jgi:hypothetical protein
MSRSEIGLQLWNIWTQEVDINRENIKISAKVSLGYFELTKHKTWFSGGCSKLADQRKQAKLKWLQEPSEINRDNLTNVRCEASRYFCNKEGISERQN